MVQREMMERSVQREATVLLALQVQREMMALKVLQVPMGRWAQREQWARLVLKAQRVCPELRVPSALKVRSDLPELLDLRV